MEDRIMQNAKELFFAYGIKSITMDDLARHMGISKKTIYKFYADKEQLVEKIVKDFIDVHATQIKQFSASAKDAIEEVILQTQAMAAIYLPIKPGVFYDIQKYFPGTWSLITQYQKDIVREAVIANLYKGIREHTYREDVQIELTSQYRMAQFDGAFNERYFPSANFNASEVISCGTELYLRGIVQAARLELLEDYLERITKNEYTENESK
jgi:AcrR family transcriptional regulator